MSQVWSQSDKYWLRYGKNSEGHQRTINSATKEEEEMLTAVKKIGSASGLTLYFDYLGWDWNKSTPGGGSEVRKLICFAKHKQQWKKLAAPPA